MRGGTGNCNQIFYLIAVLFHKMFSIIATKFKIYSLLSIHNSYSGLKDHRPRIAIKINEVNEKYS